MNRFRVTMGEARAFPPAPGAPAPSAEKQFFERSVVVVAESGQRMRHIIGPQVIPFIRQRSELIENPFRLLDGLRRTLHRHFFTPRRASHTELFLNQLEVSIMVPEQGCGIRAFP